MKYKLDPLRLSVSRDNHVRYKAVCAAQMWYADGKFNRYL